jgi:hypothetical protein
MKQTRNGNIWVAGDYNQDDDVFLACLDSDGNLKKHYHFESRVQWSSRMYFADMIKTEDGGILLSAWMGMNYPDANMFFAKLDSIGSIIWEVSIGCNKNLER